MFLVRLTKATLYGVNNVSVEPSSALGHSPCNLIRSIQMRQCCKHHIAQIGEGGNVSKVIGNWLHLICKIRRQCLFDHPILLGRSQKTADLHDAVTRFALGLRMQRLLLLAGICRALDWCRRYVN